MQRPRYDHKNIRQYYDNVYYREAAASKIIPRHLVRLSKKMNIRKGLRVMDIGCGTGKWLHAVYKQGADPVGIDLSSKAVKTCKKIIPDSNFYLAVAEALPFNNNQFHIVSALGTLEHFLDQEAALKEMARVARDDARFLLLVPNADFLTRKLGFFRGTGQVEIREDIRTLKGWQELFETAGIEVIKRWKDLHVVSWSWIAARSWFHIPIRALQAFALVFWPLSWQYQVYFLCKKRTSNASTSIPTTPPKQPGESFGNPKEKPSLMG